MREFRNPTGLVQYPGLFAVRRLIPTSTAAIQYVLNNPSIYVKPPQSLRALRSILGDGLLTAEGEMHRRQRKVLTPAFATGYIRDVMPIFNAKGNDLVEVLMEAMKAQGKEGIEMFSFLSRCTLDIIGSAGILPTCFLTARIRIRVQQYA
jgi:cytochrome P450